MRVAIVDDEQEVRNTLAEYIKRFSEEAGIEIETVSFVSGDSFLEGYMKIYDIVIFDVDMPGTNGINTARKLRETDQNVTIIFVTNIAQYAINGYEVDAVDYIIKPIGYYDFSMKFHRTVAKAAQKKEHILKIETTEGVRRIRMAAIVYVEVQAHYLFYHTMKNIYKVRGNMQDAERELSKNSFVRTHRSFVVNLSYVEKIKSNEIVAAGSTLPVGRAYKEQVKQKYMMYVRGGDES